MLILPELIKIFSLKCINRNFDDYTKLHKTYYELLLF